MNEEIYLQGLGSREFLDFFFFFFGHLMWHAGSSRPEIVKTQAPALGAQS